jgi:plasmid maintenance system antidote protein VapI
MTDLAQWLAEVEGLQESLRRLQRTARRLGRRSLVPPKPARTKPISLERLATAVGAELSAEEIAELFGVTVHQVKALIWRHGAASRPVDQPRGTWPPPHLGQLLDPSAPRAPKEVLCRGCGKAVRRCFAHRHAAVCGAVPAPEPAAVEEERKPLAARLLEHGWTAREVADGCELSEARVQELVRGLDADPAEHAALSEIAKLAPPSKKWKGPLQ